MRLIKPEFVGIELLWLESKVAVSKFLIVLVILFAIFLGIHLMRQERLIWHLSQECPQEANVKIIERGRVTCVLQPVPYGGAALKIRPGWIEEFKINRQKK